MDASILMLIKVAGFSIVAMILIKVATKIIVRTFFEEKNKNNKGE